MTCISCNSQMCFYCKEVWSEGHQHCPTTTPSSRGTDFDTTSEQAKLSNTSRMDSLSPQTESMSYGGQESTSLSSDNTAPPGSSQGTDTARGEQGQRNFRPQSEFERRKENDDDEIGRRTLGNDRDGTNKIKVHEITGIASLIDRHGWLQKLRITYCLRVHLHDEDDSLMRDHVLTHVEIAALVVEVPDSEYQQRGLPPQFTIRRTEVTIDPLPPASVHEDHCHLWYCYDAYPKRHDFDSPITRAIQFSAGAGFTTPYVFNIQGGWQQVTTETIEGFRQAVNIGASRINATSKGGYIGRYDVSTVHDAFHHDMRLFVRHYNRPCIPRTHPLHSINIKVRATFQYSRHANPFLQQVAHFLGSEKLWGMDIAHRHIELGLRTELIWDEQNRLPFPDPGAPVRRHVIPLKQQFRGGPENWVIPAEKEIGGPLRKGWVDIGQGERRG